MIVPMSTSSLPKRSRGANKLAMALPPKTMPPAMRKTQWQRSSDKPERQQASWLPVQVSRGTSIPPKKPPRTPMRSTSTTIYDSRKMFGWKQDLDVHFHTALYQALSCHSLGFGNSCLSKLQSTQYGPLFDFDIVSGYLDNSILHRYSALCFWHIKMISLHLLVAHVWWAFSFVKLTSFYPQLTLNLLWDVIYIQK